MQNRCGDAGGPPPGLWEARPRADQTSIMHLVGARAPLLQGWRSVVCCRRPAPGLVGGPPSGRPDFDNAFGRGEGAPPTGLAQCCVL